jgi:hypothetical protein
MICNECGLPFDESDLGQVINHEHLKKKIKMETDIKSKKVIEHARDIFPNAPMDFCIGVNNFIGGNYDERYLYQETSDFRLGYYRAKFEELDKNYVIGGVR